MASEVPVSSVQAAPCLFLIHSNVNFQSTPKFLHVTSSHFMTQIVYALMISLMRAAFPASFILLPLTALLLLYEE